MPLADRFDDEELGFIGAAAGGAAKLLGGIGKGIKKAVQKKKAKKKNKVIQMDPTNIEGTVRPDYLFPTNTSQVMTPIVKGALKAKAKTGKAAPRDVVKEIVAQVPPLVREQVLAALKAAKDSSASQEKTISNITEQVDDAFKPQITAMLAALQAQGISNQATYEHKDLVNRANFERDTKMGLETVMARLDALGKEFDLKLKNPKIAIVTQRLPVFGPKNVLEG